MSDPADNLPPIASDPLYPSRAIELAAQIVGVSPTMLLSDRIMPKALVRARWAVMVSMSRRGVSAASIAKRLRRDHKTVLYGLAAARNRVVQDEAFAHLLAQVDAA